MIGKHFFCFFLGGEGSKHNIVEGSPKVSTSGIKALELAKTIIKMQDTNLQLEYQRSRQSGLVCLVRIRLGISGHSNK